MGETGRHVHFKYFRGTFKLWDTLFSEAAAFADEVGPEDLIGISHSEYNNNGVVTVWYWSNEPRLTE